MVEFRLVKVENVWWERLLKDKIRQHWLRVDFQNWKDEDDLGDEKEPFEEVELLFKNFLKTLESEVTINKAKKCGGAFRKFNVDSVDELEYNDGGIQKT